MLLLRLRDLALVLYVVSTLCAAEMVAAQGAGEASSELLRIHLGDGAPPFVGSAQGLSGDTLYLVTRDGSVVSIPADGIAFLEVNRGDYRLTQRGATIGFLGGAVVGGLVSLSCQDHSQYRMVSCSTVRVSYIGIGALLGLGIGALVGSGRTRERWERGSLTDHVSLSVRPGGLGVVVSL